MVSAGPGKDPGELTEAETAALAKRAGLRNVMVSCGYINPAPLAELAKLQVRASKSLIVESDLVESQMILQVRLLSQPPCLMIAWSSG